MILGLKYLQREGGPSKTAIDLVKRCIQDQVPIRLTSLGGGSWTGVPVRITRLEIFLTHNRVISTEYLDRIELKGRFTPDGCCSRYMWDSGLYIAEAVGSEVFRVSDNDLLAKEQRANCQLADAFYERLVADRYNGSMSFTDSEPLTPAEEAMLRFFAAMWMQDLGL